MVLTRPNEWGRLAVGRRFRVHLDRTSQHLATRLELFIIRTEVKGMQSGT